MINKKQVLKAFGSIRVAAISIGVSRLTIYKWVEEGEIPEFATRGKLVGTNWHEKLAELGFDANLNPLTAD